MESYSGPKVLDRILVQNDPVNAVDPEGLWPWGLPKPDNLEDNVSSIVDYYLPGLPDDQKEQLVKDSIEEIGWTDLATAKDKFSDEPDNICDLNPSQKNVLQDFFKRLPDRNQQIVDEISKRLANPPCKK